MNLVITGHTSGIGEYIYEEYCLYYGTEIIGLSRSTGFDITKDNINLENLNVKLNNLNLRSKEILAEKTNNGYLVKGNIQNNTIEVKEEDFILIKRYFS